MSDKPTYVYILWSETLCKHYIGASSELERRLRDHKNGHSAYTKKGTPWRMVWKTLKSSKSEALKLERKLKNLKSKDRIKAFINKHSGD